MYEIKAENVYEDFSKDKETFDFNVLIYCTNSKYFERLKQISCW